MFYCNFVFFWLHLQKKKQCTDRNVHVLCSYSSIKGFMSCLTCRFDALFHNIYVVAGLRGFCGDFLAQFGWHPSTLLWSVSCHLGTCSRQTRRLFTPPSLIVIGVIDCTACEPACCCGDILNKLRLNTCQINVSRQKKQRASRRPVISSDASSYPPLLIGPGEATCSRINTSSFL